MSCLKTINIQTICHSQQLDTTSAKLETIRNKENMNHFRGAEQKIPLLCIMVGGSLKSKTALYKRSFNL